MPSETMRNAIKSGKSFKQIIAERKRNMTPSQKRAQTITNKRTGDVHKVLSKAQRLGKSLKEGQQKTLKGTTIGGKTVQVKKYGNSVFTRMSAGKGKETVFNGMRRENGSKSIFSGSLTRSKSARAKASTGHSGG